MIAIRTLQSLFNLLELGFIVFFIFKPILVVAICSLLIVDVHLIVKMNINQSVFISNHCFVLLSEIRRLILQFSLAFILLGKVPLPLKFFCRETLFHLNTLVFFNQISVIEVLKLCIIMEGVSRWKLLSSEFSIKTNTFGTLQPGFRNLLSN